MERGTIHRQVRCQCLYGIMGGRERERLTQIKLCHRNVDLFLGLYSNLINNSTSFTQSFIRRVNVSLVKLPTTYKR